VSWGATFSAEAPMAELQLLIVTAAEIEVNQPFLCGMKEASRRKNWKGNGL
jgi:hypothetical protein